MRALSVIAFLASAFTPCVSAQADIESGKRSFAVCAGCHGFEGQGNALVGAPRLAGIETWYLDRQMRSFRDGLRGHIDGDVNGRRMAQMARVADNERELEDLLAYIATLPGDHRPPVTVPGDANRGSQLFALCTACHGARAEGNENLAAPGLTALEDWYLVEQLRLYAENLRGTEAADVYGQQMRSLASGFADDEARRAIAAHINSIER